MIEFHSKIFQNLIRIVTICISEFSPLFEEVIDHFYHIISTAVLQLLRLGMTDL
jgi:hypothetical protein